MQDFPPYQHPRSMMSRYPAEPANQATCACDQGNRLWLENHSGQDMSVAVTVGSETSSILPQTASQPTRLGNTVAGSGGPLDLTVNGESTLACWITSIQPC